MPEKNLVTITLDDYDLLAGDSVRINVLVEELVNRDMTVAEILRMLGRPSHIEDYEERVKKDKDKLANW